MVMFYSRIAPKSTILMNGELLEEVKSFKHLGSIISSEDYSTEEICIRINLAKSASKKISKTQEDMEQQKHQNGNKDTTL